MGIIFLMFFLVLALIILIPIKIIKSNKIKKQGYKICVYCKSQIDPKASVCPHCTKKPDDMRVLTSVFNVIISVIIIIIILTIIL